MTFAEAALQATIGHAVIALGALVIAAAGRNWRAEGWRDAGYVAISAITGGFVADCALMVAAVAAEVAR